MSGFLRWPVRVEDTDPSTFTFYNDDATDAQIEVDDLTARADLSGMVIRLAIEWPGGALLLATGTDAEIILENQAVPLTMGRVTVTLTSAQRAALPADGGIRFNFQRVNGALRVSNPYGELVAMKWVENA